MYVPVRANAVDYRWWSSEEPHSAVFGHLDHIQHADSDRAGLYLQNMRLYGNINSLGYDLDSYYQIRTPDRLSYNAVEAVSDALVSKIARVRPRPVFLTNGGAYEARRQARLLERFVDQQFYDLKVHQLAPRIQLDACVFGDGIVKPYRVEKKIYLDRVFPGEVFVDPAEALYGAPLTWYQRKWVGRDTLAALYSDKAELVELADTPSSGGFARDRAADQVEVVEAWRLPAAEGEPGYYCVALRNGLLCEPESWPHRYPPFVVLPYKPRLRGFWSMSLAEKLAGLQIEINRTLQKIQQAMKMVVTPRAWVDHASKVTGAHLNNDPNVPIVRYTGQRPVIETPQGITTEMANHLERMKSWAYEQEGLNPFAASGTVPPGVTAGVGIREFGEQLDVRFSVRQQLYEEFHMELGRRLVDLGHEIAQEYPDWSVKSSRDKWTVQEAKFADINLPSESYVLKVYPSSLLPTMPGGRKSEVADMMQSGIITDPKVARRLLDFPDLEAETNVEQAAEDFVDWAVEQMLDEGKYIPPEPFGDLQLHIRRVQAAYNRASIDGAPDDRLQLLRDHMTHAQALAARPMQPGMYPQTGEPPPEGAAGMPANAAGAPGMSPDAVPADGSAGPVPTSF